MGETGVGANLALWYDVTRRCGMAGRRNAYATFLKKIKLYNSV